MSAVRTLPVRRRSLRELLANPWGRARFLWVVAIGYVVWTLLPVVIAMLFSLNRGRSLSTFQGLSLRWYWGDPADSVWHNAEYRDALFQTLRVSFLTVLIAVPLGVAFAIALDRWRGRIPAGANFVVMFSFVAPEIVLGVAFFLFFTKLVTAVGLGTTGQVLGLATLQLAYPVIIVRARLLSIGSEYEEAAMDLGASPLQAIRRVLLPLLAPAIFASIAVVFASTIDDFVIVRALSSDAPTETIPVKIYSSARGAPTPVLNAMATVTLILSITAIVIAVLLYRRMTRGERAEGESAAAVSALEG